MKFLAAILSFALLACAVLLAQTRGSKSGNKEQTTHAKPSTAPAASSEINAAVSKGARWLAAVQGNDGGWGQDGGASSNVRDGERLESQGNDVANTAVAALALLRAGNQYRPNVERAVDFILKRIEASPAEGLAITDVKETQIQRKLGPYIDTFLASMLLTEIDGTFAGTSQTRLRRGLEKCVAKIEKNQSSDGSWNVGGGWAPVLGTSLASRSLYQAREKGLQVSDQVMARADSYTKNNQQGQSSGGGVGGGGGRSTVEASETVTIAAASAGVALYQDAQALEQLSRTAKDREANKKEIAAISGKLSNAGFVEGYGSIGGEEFFSYLNISDSLKRTGGKEWSDWHAKITQKILKLQNSDGTWAGHHCITGRVAVTSAAMLNLYAK